MAGISNSSFAGANSALFTFSGWVRVPSCGGVFGLIEFGSNPDLLTNRIQINCNNAVSPLGFKIRWEFYSNDLLFTFRDQGISGETINYFAFDTWHHIIMAVDTSPQSVVNTSDTTTTGWHVTSTGVWDGVTTTTSTPPFGTAGSDGQTLFYADSASPPATGWYFTYGSYTITSHNLLLSGKKTYLMVDAKRCLTTNDRSVDDPWGQFEGFPNASFYSYGPTPGFTINANAKEFGIPTQAANLAGTATKFQASDFQIWMGKFIDPTISTNFDKFVSITNGVGKPRSPSAASSAFGTQTILLHGKASDGSFYRNRGNGGAFVKTGTISDFTPTPSYS